MDWSNPLVVVGMSGVALVVVCWLSLAIRGTDSARLAWLGALGLYAALGSFFVNLFQGAESWAGKGVFGFLALMFGAGLVLSIVRVARAMAGSEAAKAESATN